MTNVNAYGQQPYIEAEAYMKANAAGENKESATNKSEAGKQESADAASSTGKAQRVVSATTQSQAELVKLSYEVLKAFSGKGETRVASELAAAFNADNEDGTDASQSFVNMMFAMMASRQDAWMEAAEKSKELEKELADIKERNAAAVQQDAKENVTVAGESTNSKSADNAAMALEPLAPDNPETASAPDKETANTADEPIANAASENSAAKEKHAGSPGVDVRKGKGVQAYSRSGASAGESSQHYTRSI